MLSKPWETTPAQAGDVTIILPITYAQVTAPNVPLYAAPTNPAMDIPPIKTLGVHRVPVRLHADVLAEVSVTVMPQE